MRESEHLPLSASTFRVRRRTNYTSTHLRTVLPPSVHVQDPVLSPSPSLIKPSLSLPPKTQKPCDVALSQRHHPPLQIHFRPCTPSLHPSIPPSGSAPPLPSPSLYLPPDGAIGERASVRQSVRHRQVTCNIAEGPRWVSVRCSRSCGLGLWWGWAGLGWDGLGWEGRRWIRLGT